MLTPTSTTRWRDTPIVPVSYDDVASLVALARRARMSVVDFDWYFSAEDLGRLQRVVYERGRRYTGRYRTFDARVLSAIRDGLGDTNTILILREHKSGDALAASVTCERLNGLFRLHGYAPFVMVFGYGALGLGEHTHALGPVACATLADSVSMLAWDLRRLRDDPRLRPVVNALYGNRLSDGVHSPPEPQTPPEAPHDVAVHFSGPFVAGNAPGLRCLFTDPIAGKTGIYLWTVNIDGVERVWYVGQTRVRFGIRTGQHLASMLSGEYTTYDSDALAQGRFQRVGEPRTGRWPETLPSFLHEYTVLAPHIAGTIRLLRFHFAPLTGDGHLYNRVEGAIARIYKKHTDDALRNFLTPGLRVPAAVPFDKPLRLLLSSEVPIAGLQQELLI